jgi:hypothetical protein
VLAGVPAARRDVEATTKGQGIVDHHDLLVMGSTDGVLVVQSKMHSPVTLPVKAQEGKHLALERVEWREVPTKSMDTETGLSARDGVEAEAQLVLLRRHLGVTP